MYPSFSPIRLTIVDFLGVFLPGIVWTILLFTLWGMINPPQGYLENLNPLTIAYFLATGKDSFLSTNKAKEFGTVFYVGLTLFSVFLGYLDMAASTILPEYASHLLCKIIPLNKSNSLINDYLFPYTEYFRKKSYYSQLIQILKLELNSPIFSEFATYHPFETCKRILKIYQSPLWEDAQYREAQVRMLASLFVASLFNLGLAVGNTGFFNYTIFKGFCIIAIIFFLIFKFNKNTEELVKMLLGITNITKYS